MLMAVHPGETRNLLFVLDDYESKTLYFKDTDANNYNAKTKFDFIIGDSAFANCPNLTEVKMMQYTTRGDNHWEALKADQVSSVGMNIFDGSPQANFSTDASEFQNYLISKTWRATRRASSSITTPTRI